MSKVSVSRIHFFPFISTFFHFSWLSSGLPLVLRSISSGSLTGNCSSGIFTTLLFSSYAIGIGQPQYLCLDIPQSFNLKLVFFLPKFLSSKIFIVSLIYSLGTFKLFKNLEFMIMPGPA